MARKNSIFLVLFLFFSVGVSFGQEEVPLKTFEFNISLNKLKTEQQAADIRNEVGNLPGVKECQLVLIEYNLKFICTNHDMVEHKIIDRIKAIVVELGAEIVNINRTER
ncbi:MAG: hypothetical protein R2780_10015 [Crocinitomicaceae bacterium]|nr:hypothetical protein [Crocinitomicaceae bacterium]